MTESPIWPTPSPASAFAERRRRLQERLRTPALIVAGFPRPRNFAANLYPYRAESHFLYFVGRALPGAALMVRPDSSVLFVEPPEADEAFWSGPQKSLAELERELGLSVRPMAELTLPEGTATLPAQDAETAFWQSDLLERDIDPGSGHQLAGTDLELADAVIDLRLRHDAAAIRQLEQAAEATGRAHWAGMRATQAGLREAQVRARMQAEIIAAGMRCAYQPIVTVHGEVLHSESIEQTLRAGDLLLADVGAETPEGWAADVTRTWPVSGRFSSTQRELYQLVLEAQRAAIDHVKPGVRYLEVHRVAGRTITRGLVELGVLRGDPEELYQRGAAALFFPHGVGHLLGLDVHDLEDLGDRAGYGPERARNLSRGDRYLRLDRVLEPGMLVTVEPGFYHIEQLLTPEEVGDLKDALDRQRLSYFEDVRGIRIEDDVLVTSDGNRVLTGKIPKTPEEVQALVGG